MSIETVPMGLLDGQIRILREDTVRQPRNAVHEEITRPANQFKQLEDAWPKSKAKISLVN